MHCLANQILYATSLCHMQSFAFSRLALSSPVCSVLHLPWDGLLCQCSVYNCTAVAWIAACLVDTSQRDVFSNPLVQERARFKMKKVYLYCPCLYAAVDLGKPVKSWEKVMSDASSPLNHTLVWRRERESESESESESKTQSLSMMSLGANGSMQWHLSAAKLHLQPVCMAAHMAPQHHIFTMPYSAAERGRKFRDVALWLCALMLIYHVCSEIACSSL